MEVDPPARVSVATVADPGDNPHPSPLPVGEGEGLPLLLPAMDEWLRKYGAVLGISLFLVAATAAVYSQTVGFDFVSYDDNQYVYENRHVKEGFNADSLLWAFTGVHAANWYPLTTLTHILDWTLYGKWAGGHHLTNVLLHAASSVVLFLALRRLTGGTWRSGLVAALFCLHPAHVESVAWVSERKDVLSGLFFGLTLWAYAGYAKASREQGAGSSEQGEGEKGRKGEESTEQGAGRGTFPWGRYALVVVFFALGLLSKPILVTLPLVLLLLDFWPLERWGKSVQCSVFSVQRSDGEGEKGGKGEGEIAATRPHPLPLSQRARGAWLVLEKVPLVALAAADCVVTYLVQRSGGAVNEAAPLALCADGHAWLFPLSGDARLAV